MHSLRALSRTHSIRTAGVAALVLGVAAAPWAASADSVQVDGDSSSTSNSKNSQFTLCEGVGSSVDVVGKLDYTGTGRGAKHFSNGGTVTITASVPSAAAAFLNASGATVVTSNWTTTGATVSSAAMPLTVDTDWKEGTYPVTYTFTGVDENNAPYVLTDTNNVQIIAATDGCDDEEPPPNSAPTVDVTGFADGDVVEIGTAVNRGCQVSDAEDGAQSSSPEVSGPVGPLSAYGLGEVTVTCSYTDTGGLAGTDKASYTIVDTGKPVIVDEGPQSDPDGLNGWYVSAVTNGFRATDSGAGFPTDTPKLLSYGFGQSSGGSEGSTVTVSSGTVSDVAGNVADAIDSGPFQIDLSDPLLNVTGAPTGTTYDLCTGGVPTRPTFAPSDAISGLDGSEDDSWTQPSTTSGVGTYTYSAAAQDVAGRTSSDTRVYRSVYGSAFAGVTQPINGGMTPELTDDSSRFKLGSTVPVKFRLACGSSPIDNAVARLTVKVADNKPDAGTDEAVSTAASTTGNLFRYDAAAGQYIFNLNTRSGYTNPGGGTVAFAQGTYTLSIVLDDGTHRQVNINLTK
jgi:hypothetical protein